ncbi:hypothetical protein CPLU01_00548 [Colletotrichum plurivorum]|uniref:Uncharacterized protein n=1 Tax=Colletotrichum plurivorum TaxID=2175906 RepID=A0A8H6NRW8_9PEZI|nr:hypothetical protein CPLU01_00548 [Colletotrichum plurivorum]
MEFFKVYFKPTDDKGSGTVGRQQVELPPGGAADADADDVVMSSQSRASSRRETPAGVGGRGQLLLAARRQEPTSHRQRPRARLTSWRSKLDGCPATFTLQASCPQIQNSCSASVGSIPPTVHPTIEWASASPSSQTRTLASRTCSVAAAGRAVGGGTVSSREPKGFWQVRIVCSERRSVRAARDDVVASDKKPPKRGVQLEQGVGSQPSTHSHLIEQDASEPDRASRRQDQDYGQGRWAGPSERQALGLAERARESGRELWPVAMAEMERKPCELPICPSRSPAHPSKSHVFGPGLAPCIGPPYKIYASKFTSAKPPAFKHASDHGSQCPGRTATQHPYHDSHRAILCQTCLKTLIAGHDPATEKCKPGDSLPKGSVPWRMSTSEPRTRKQSLVASRDDSRRRCNGVEGKPESNRMPAATELRRTGGDWAGRYANSPLISWTATVMCVVRTSCLSSEARRSSWHGKADDEQRRAMIFSDCLAPVISHFHAVHIPLSTQERQRRTDDQTLARCWLLVAGVGVGAGSGAGCALRSRSTA